MIAYFTLFQDLLHRTDAFLLKVLVVELRVRLHVVNLE